MTDKKLPTVILCVAGKVHLIYALWCIRSLKQFGYESIEIAVSNSSEKKLFQKYYSDVPCNVVSIDIGRYPAFSYKPFALTQYLERIGLQYQQRNIVVCDADILWKQNPAPLFQRFSGHNWVHKITAVDPADYNLDQSEVPEDNIGLRTILNYDRRYEISIYPNFNVNAGLFMLPKDTFPIMLEKWLGKITALPPDEMLMSEALMALTYAELGLTPISDQSDIKYFGRHKNLVTNRPSFPLDSIDTVPIGMFSGYETAKHYFGNQRPMLHRDAVAMGLDPDRLATEVVLRVFIRKLIKALKSPRRLIRKLIN